MNEQTKAESSTDRRAVDLKIMTPETVLADRSNLEWVRLVLANENVITIWPGHAPLVAETADWPITIMNCGKLELIEVAPAILKVNKDTITLLTLHDKKNSSEEHIESDHNPADTDRLADDLVAVLHADRSELSQFSQTARSD
jgi:F0F1-type ATP synthase epsilon subunit